MKFRGKGTQKLMPKYVGPYKIEKKVGPVAYRLVMPAKSSIHPTFHVSLLKPYKGSTEELNEQAAPPAPVMIGHDKLVTIEKLLDHEDRKTPGRNSTLKRFFLVRWQGYPPSEDSWEPEKELKGKEPHQEYLRAQEARGRPVN